MDCFVCNKFINGDAAAVEHHINKCLDGASDSQQNEHGALKRGPCAAAQDDEHNQIAKDRALAEILSNDDQSPSRGAQSWQMDRDGSGDSSHSSSSKRRRTNTWSPPLELDRVVAGPSQQTRTIDADVSGNKCRICGNSWQEMDTQSREDKKEHVDLCRQQTREWSNLWTVKRDAGWKFGWDSAGQDDKLKSVGGLVPVLATLLSRAHKEGRTRSAYLASDRTLHIGSRLMDAGWSCGYRNIQMFLSSVRHLEQYARLSATLPLAIPSILDLQQIIEQAWSEGYDPLGAAHFGNKLVKSRRWIGTTEAYAALTWLGFRVQIIDFPKVPGASGTNDALVNWILEYFQVDSSTHKKQKNAMTALMASSGQAVRMTKKQPLYLQHHGHSRTVVGVDVAKDGQAWLILFDPGKSVSTTMSRAASARSSPQSSEPSSSSTHAAFWSQNPTNSFSLHSPSSLADQTFKLDTSNYRKLLEPYRVSLKSLKRNEEYQIVCVQEGESLSEQEKELRKLVTSTRVVT
ncbi:hypothetical protein ACM66B_006486 [Microbotryomycetes sp. NB124-2]